MNVKPVGNRVLIELHFPVEEENVVILPDRNLSPDAGEQRTKVECKAIGDLVTVCKPGDSLLLAANVMERGFLPTNKEPAQGLIHDSMVLGIILDDPAYAENRNSIPQT